MSGMPPCIIWFSNVCLLHREVDARQNVSTAVPVRLGLAGVLALDMKPPPYHCPALAPAVPQAYSAGPQIAAPMYVFAGFGGGGGGGGGGGAAGALYSSLSSY